MNFYSINKQSPRVDFKQATIAGQAPDKGLYFPESIPLLKKTWLNNLATISNEEICLHVIRPYTGTTIPEEKLLSIIKETISFPVPLIEINNRISSLELFHGPTMAFKDIGARFMSRCIGYFVSDLKKKVTVLVATSGDTGGAVADGFYGVDGVEVIILYPSGKVSPVQEQQLTTYGGNIKAYEVDGSFDDCQQMVKEAFTDKDLTAHYFLTSANSINVARWLPQQFYYFFAIKNWKAKDHKPVISVPSGNFGNICAGLLAMQSGLPVKHFIAACNANDVVTKYLHDANLYPQKAIPTLSNAMDVGNPSNFIRILELFQHQYPAIKEKLSSYSISDEETLAVIRRVHDRYQYMLDPHGAVAWASLEKFLDNNPNNQGIILETAHSSKFPAAIKKAIHREPDIPDNMKNIMNKKQTKIKIKADYKNWKDLLLQ